MVTFKDIFYLALGTLIGLIAGVALYWLPLGQFLNEWRALWDLVRRRYKQGDLITVKAGTDLQGVVSSYPLTATAQVQMRVWHDDGVGWFHTRSGWKRARVLHVFRDNDEKNFLYKVCHLDLEG